jgi:hypothetical protein
MKTFSITSLVLSFLISSFPLFLYSQAPDTLWIKYYSTGQYYDKFFSVDQTADSGFVATGWADDADVVKTDKNGNSQWTFSYPGFSHTGREIKQTADGGCIVVGDNYNSGFWLCKIDLYGNYEWDKTLDGGYSELGLSVDQTADGGFVAVGYSKSFSTTHNHDIWLVRMNEFGDTIWTKVIGGYADDLGYSVSETTDGGFIIGGQTQSFGAGAFDIWLIKTNSAGDTTWTKTYGGPDFEYGNGQVKQTMDGGYVIIGSTKSFGAGSNDFWLIKTDSLGNIEWDKTFGGTSSEYGYSVDELESGGFIIAGINNSIGDMFIVRTDGLGNYYWSINGFSTLTDAAHSIQQTFDGGFIIAGSIYKYPTLVRLAPENLVPSVIVLNPNGGEELIVDSDYSINWYSNGVDTVFIEYTTDDGITWLTVSSVQPASSGSYLWSVPNTPSNQCRVKISDKSNSSISDLSDEVFTIRSELNSIIKVLSPNGGEELTPETFYSITWNSVNVVDVKIELSINNGASWTEIIDSVPSSGLYNWFVPKSPSIQSLIKITHLNDLTSYDISDSIFTIKDISDVEENLLPNEYKLLDNYPDPFNPSTKIKYQIPELSFITIKIYDILGNEIVTLVNDEKPAGSYEVEFDSNSGNVQNLTSGIYFYKLQTGNFVETKKMILLK